MTDHSQELCNIAYSLERIMCRIEEYSSATDKRLDALDAKLDEVRRMLAGVVLTNRQPQPETVLTTGEEMTYFIINPRLLYNEVSCESLTGAKQTADEMFQDFNTWKVEGYEEGLIIVRVVGRLKDGEWVKMSALPEDAK